MQKTHVDVVTDINELNQILKEYKVLNVQAFQNTHTMESILKGGGMISQSSLFWSVWYEI